MKKVPVSFFHLWALHFSLFGLGNYLTPTCCKTCLFVWDGPVCTVTHMCLSRPGSITLFAFITVVLGCLKVAYFIGFSECLSATEGVFPVTHAVHTLLQVNSWCLFMLSLLQLRQVCPEVCKSPHQHIELVGVRFSSHLWLLSGIMSWPCYFSGTLGLFCFTSCGLDPFRITQVSCF